MTKIEILLDTYQRAAANLVTATGCDRAKAKQQYEIAREAFGVGVLSLDSETQALVSEATCDAARTHHHYPPDDHATTPLVASIAPKETPRYGGQISGSFRG